MKTVLVVEDNALNNKLFCDLLQNMGHHVISTQDGQGVVELVRDQKPDMVIMDINLPHVSGLEIIKRIKGDSVLCVIPLIVVTAFAMKDEIQEVHQSGCDDFMVKPIALAEFRLMVEKYLGEIK